MYGPTVEPLVHRVLTRGGNGTCFACVAAAAAGPRFPDRTPPCARSYGQTGSGKTYTMQGLQRLAVQQLFEGRHGLARGGAGLRLFVSCFEIYGGRCLDLLHDRARLHVREDGQGVVQIAGLEEEEVGSRTACEQLLEEAARRRTTHVTAVHAQSSRSHAILTLALRGPRGEDRGKLSLIDLAGSERASETSSHDRQLRAEGAEINKSLLGLKECIRAMDREDLTHVPYRASKLTLVLKDSFTSPNSRTVMIATVSPTHAAADHSLNTLRYADRIKEKKVHAPVTPARGYGGSGFSDDSHMDGRPDATALVAGSSDDDDGGLEELGRPSGDDDGVGETGSDDTEGEEEARVMPQRPGPRRRRRVRDVPARWLRAQGREETRPLPDTGLHRGGPALSGAAGDSGVGVTASAGARAPAPLRGLSADDFDAIPPQTASSGEDERGWAAGEGRDGEEEEGNRGAQSPTRRSSGGNRPPAPVRDGTTGRGARAGREGEGGKRQPGLLGRIFRFGRRATGSGSQRRGTEDGGGGGDDEGEARKGQYSAESEAEGEAEVARRRSAPKAQEEEEGKVEGEERGAETGAHSAWSVAQRRAPGGPSSARRGASLLEPGPRRAREPRSADDVRGRRSGAGRKAGSSGGGRSADPTLTPPLTREDSGPRARAGRLKPRLQPTPGAEGKAGAGDGSPGEGQVATARREDDEDEGEDEERGGHSGGRRASPQPPRAHRPRRPGPPASSSSAQASAERSPSLWVATPEAVEGTAPYRPGRRISPQATVVAAEGNERSAAASPSDAGGAGQKEGQGAALASPPDHGVRARPVTSPSPSKHTHLRDRADWQRGAGQGAVPLSPAAKRLRAARRLELEGHISSQERSRLKEAILKREEWAGEGRSKVVPPSPDHASSLSVAAAVEPRLEPRIVLPDQQPTAEARFGAADTVAAAPRGEGGDRAATRHHRSPQGGRGGDRGAQGGLERVHSAVQELVDEEDMLVASHGRHIEVRGREGLARGRWVC